MRKIIADSGPLIALFDPDDAGHDRARRFLRGYDGILLSTWPVLTEVGHMLGHSVDRQIDFLEWIRRGAVELPPLPEHAIDTAVRLSRTYRNVPMDLADASLLILAASSGVREILTFDSDFEVYRLPDKSKLNNVLAQSRRAR